LDEKDRSEKESAVEDYIKLKNSLKEFLERKSNIGSVFNKAYGDYKNYVSEIVTEPND
jgi:hypothetical protein